jgi:uncharacterized protein (TIGR02147 family)
MRITSNTLFPKGPGDFRLFLQSELVKRVKKNPKYSLRAFASSLNVSHSALSQILRGQRPLTGKAIKKLGEGLGLDPEQLNGFLQGTALAEANIEASNSAFSDLTMDSFQVIADWYHFAILELLLCGNFQPDMKVIARQLGISVAEVSAAVERLIRLKMLEIKPNGKWVDLTIGNTTTVAHPFTNVALKKLQRQILEKAMAALEEIPLEMRDQTGMLMAVDSRKLAGAKEIIKNFRRQMADYFGKCKDHDHVFQLSVSLFPVTQVQKNKERDSE